MNTVPSWILNSFFAITLFNLLLCLYKSKMRKTNEYLLNREENKTKIDSFILIIQYYISKVRSVYLKLSILDGLF